MKPFDPNEDVVAQFDRRSDTYEFWSLWMKDNVLFDLITRPLAYLVPDAECLDLCGGVGWLAMQDAAISDRRWTVLDLSSGMGEHVVPPVKFVLGDAQKTELPDNSFDFIVITSAFQYLQPEKVFAEVSRLLRHEGLFVCAEKTLNSNVHDLEWYVTWQRRRNPHKKGFIEFPNEISRWANDTDLVHLDLSTCTQHHEMSLNDWVARENDVRNRITEKEQAEIIERIRGLDEEASRRIGIRIEGDRVHATLNWSINVFQKGVYHRPSTKVVVSLIVEHEVRGQKYILLQSRQKPYDEPMYLGFLELPQGKVEEGEDLVRAAGRELREETGLRLVQFVSQTEVVENAGVRVETVEPLTCVRMSGGVDYLSHCFVVRANGTPRSVLWRTEPNWRPVTELADLLENEAVYPLNVPMIRAYLDSVSDSRDSLAN